MARLRIGLGAVLALCAVVTFAATACKRDSAGSVGQKPTPQQSSLTADTMRPMGNARPTETRAPRPVARPATGSAPAATASVYPPPARVEVQSIFGFRYPLLSKGDLVALTGDRSQPIPTTPRQPPTAPLPGC